MIIERNSLVAQRAHERVEYRRLQAEVAERAKAWKSADENDWLLVYQRATELRQSVDELIAFESKHDCAQDRKTV